MDCIVHEVTKSQTRLSDCHFFFSLLFLAQWVKNPPAIAEDPGSISGSGRSPGEGSGYPLQYSWVSLVTQLVKNLPAMQETLVQFLGQEDPLEKGRSTHSSILRLL